MKYIYQYMGKISCVECRSVHLKFHAKHRTYPWKDTNFIRVENLSALRLKSSYMRFWNAPTIPGIKHHSTTKICHSSFMKFCILMILYLGLPEKHSLSNWATTRTYFEHDDVIKWKHFPRYWPFVPGIHRSPVNSPHKGQWRGTLMFSLICARISGWVKTGEAGDLRRHRAHYDVMVMGKLVHGRKWLL